MEAQTAPSIYLYPSYLASPSCDRYLSTRRVQPHVFETNNRKVRQPHPLRMSELQTWCVGAASLGSRGQLRQVGVRPTRLCALLPTYRNKGVQTATRHISVSFVYST